jgi:hypothetical protein
MSLDRPISAAIAKRVTDQSEQPSLFIYRRRIESGALIISSQKHGWVNRDVALRREI